MNNAALTCWPPGSRRSRNSRRRSRNGSVRAGVATPEQAAGKSGLEFLGGLLRGELPFALIAETLDFFLVEVEKGRAVFQGRPSRRLYNPLGTVHGGWYATLLDSAVGCAVHTCMSAGRSYTTLELKVKFDGFQAYVRLLAIPLLLVQFERPGRGWRVVVGFLMSCTALLVLSL